MNESIHEIPHICSTRIILYINVTVYISTGGSGSVEEEAEEVEFGRV